MKAPSAGHRFGDFFRSPAKENEIDAQDAKCKHCGEPYACHAHISLQCPNGGGKSNFIADKFFAPVSRDPGYAESIEKACDTIGFLVGEIKDAHTSAPSVAAEMLLLSWLEQIVKIRQGLNRLNTETKGA